MRRIPKAKLGFTVWAALAFAFLYLPIVVMVVFAFNKPSAAAVENLPPGYEVGSLSPDQVGNVSVWNGFTPAWFPAGLRDPTYIPAIVTSLEIAFAAAIIATVLGLLAALALARMRRRWRAPFDVLVYLTLVVPEIVIAVASLIFFVQAHHYLPLFPGLGRGTILLGQVVFNASLAMLIIRARFVGMGDTLEEASYDLGRGPALHVPAGDAAAADAGDRGGLPAVVHVLVRRLHRARVHQRDGEHVADRPLLGRPLRYHARRERAGHPVARHQRRCSSSSRR